MQEPATRAAGGTQSNSDLPTVLPYPGRIFAITQAGINTLQVTGMGFLACPPTLRRSQTSGKCRTSSG